MREEEAAASYLFNKCLIKPRKISSMTLNLISSPPLKLTYRLPHDTLVLFSHKFNINA